MIDFTFDIKIHVGGCFVKKLTIEYVGGFVHLLTEIDPDKLSFFEIRDLCYLVGTPKEHSRYKYLLPEGNLQVDLRDIVTDADVLNMTTLHRAWPAEKIIVCTDINVEPLAVEYPDEGGVAHGGVGGDGGEVTAGVGGDGGGVAAGVGGNVGGDALRDEIDLDGDYDDDENDKEEDVEDVEDVEGEDDDDDDWLNKGLEGADFGDDVFVAQNSAPQGYAPNTAPELSNAPHTAPKSSNAVHADPEWAEPALKDDLVSMDGSNDEQVPEQVEFNAKSDMRNVVQKKEMKFPNAKVFRAALREYAIKKPVDIKFKLNERTKISVHCKNGCGWRCYAS